MKALVPGSRIWMCPEAVESQWVYLKQRGDRDFFLLRNCLEAVAMLDQEVREEWQKVDVRDTSGLGGGCPFLKCVDREEMEGGGEGSQLQLGVAQHDSQGSTTGAE